MKFKKYKCLGSGSYGSVYLAGIDDNSFFTSSRCAVKSAHSSSSISYLLREKKFLDELLGDPYIIQCFGDDQSIEKGERVYNVMMEYAPGGTLDELMKKRNGRIPESEVACYAAMLLHGLCIAHKKGIVHCDMKPDNVLVFPVAKGDGVINNVLKIADFGLAKKVWEEEEADRSGERSLNRGALHYASPEGVVSGLHLPATDVWSLGCILVEMLTGEPVWRYGATTDLIYKLSFEKPEIPDFVSETGRDFLEKCLDRDYEKRWTTMRLLKHPFIANNLRHFRGYEHMICERNPFHYTGVRRRHIYRYCGSKSISLPMPLMLGLFDHTSRKKPHPL